MTKSNTESKVKSLRQIIKYIRDCTCASVSELVSILRQNKLIYSRRWIKYILKRLNRLGLADMIGRSKIWQLTMIPTDIDINVSILNDRQFVLLCHLSKLKSGVIKGSIISKHLKKSSGPTISRDIHNLVRLGLITIKRSSVVLFEVNDQVKIPVSNSDIIEDLLEDIITCSKSKSEVGPSF